MGTTTVVYILSARRCTGSQLKRCCYTTRKPPLAHKAKHSTSTPPEHRAPFCPSSAHTQTRTRSTYQPLAHSLHQPTKQALPQLSKHSTPRHIPMMRLQKSKSIRNLRISAPMSPLPPLPTETFENLPPVPSPTHAQYHQNNMAPRTTPDSAVILITKFDFKAENRHELTVGVGEAVKLLERKGNGWILVKPIGRISEPGLIPAGYVRIVRLNKERTNSKSDEKWLSQSDSAPPSPLSNSSTDFEEVPVSPKTRVRSQDQHTVQKLEQQAEPTQSGFTSSTTTSSSNTSSLLSSPIERDHEKYSSVDTSTSESSASTSSERNTAEQTFFSMQSSNASSYGPWTPASVSEEAPYPVSGLVRNANSYNGRYWYRVDIAMSDGKKRYLCRYYQDFYKLHCALVENVILTKKKGEAEQALIDQLPQLPDPMARPDLQTLSTIVLQRCQSLNVYIFMIVRNKAQLNYGTVLDEWCKPRLGDLELGEETTLSNDSIEELLKPIPTNLKKTNDKTLSQQMSIQTAMTPPLPALQTSSFFHPNARSSSSSSMVSFTPSLPSPKIWQSPTFTQSPQFRSERHASTPTIPEGQELQQKDWINSPTEPLFVGASKSKRNASCPDPQTQENIVCVKMKVYFQNDIFALKFNKESGILAVKESLAKRLECDADALRLYYKNPVKNYYSPLVDDMDVASAFEHFKVCVKVHIWDNKI